MRRRTVIATVVAGLTLTLALGGCGIPTESSARPIDREALPQAVVEPPTTTTTPSDPSGLNKTAKLFLVTTSGDQEALATLDADIVNVTNDAELPRLVIEQLIAQTPKADGSSSDLTNAIPPNTQVLNATLDGDVLDLDLTDLGSVELSRQRLAAAQIVFTATALPGIRGVRFSIEGQPASVPIDNETSAPGAVVTTADYPSLEVNL